LLRDVPHEDPDRGKRPIGGLSIPALLRIACFLGLFSDPVVNGSVSIERKFEVAVIEILFISQSG
jgi:hypothetical protein